MTGDHYFTAEPSTAAQPREVEFTVAGRDWTLASAGGVFSAARLDPGTAVLLRKADLPSASTTGHLLDIGCGFGPITCVLATCATAATVWAVDVNERARELTAANAARVGAAERVRVAAPDDVPADVTFAEIWSNPPIRIGKEGLHDLLARWLPRLAPDGVAWLVVARHLGGDSLHRWLVDSGWQVGRHASQKGYRVLRVTR
ncbi:class I SAM-dependent methyltransferase [Micromonospora endolithica]|uniref:Methyltransferase domain-containing protein n=1 Tax=Micromonospora endolithica TaxID=230091 RepID=A0A3A9Z900_9ACTN|nr:methyltransferase [Micromonospora endolithica]RKN44529.1 methyltransferase domain-containing protein [Micromonospora endolithica]TWJ25857.1 16S rRNA m(2)G 1207 methyltransferase [Micromonospora endolithica]